MIKKNEVIKQGRHTHRDLNMVAHIMNMVDLGGDIVAHIMIWSIWVDETLKSLKIVYKPLRWSTI